MSGSDSEWEEPPQEQGQSSSTSSTGSSSDSDDAPSEAPLPRRKPAKSARLAEAKPKVRDAVARSDGPFGGAGPDATNSLVSRSITAAGKGRGLTATESKEAEKAQKWLQRFCVDLTGMSPGDVAKGVLKNNTGALIQAVNFLPPCLQHVELVLRHLRIPYLTKLGGVPRFTDMDLAEREAKLLAEAAPPCDPTSRVREDDMSQYAPDTRFSLLQVGTGEFASNMDAGEQEAWMADGQAEAPRGRTPAEILAMFPFKPGSRGLRGLNVLCCLPSFWRLQRQADSAAAADAATMFAVLDASEGKVLAASSGLKPSAEQKLFVLNEIPTRFSARKRRGVAGMSYDVSQEGQLGVLVGDPRRGLPLNAVSMVEVASGVLARMRQRAQLADESVPLRDLPPVAELMADLSRMSAAGLKSTLQKLIRFRPRRVEFSAGYVVDGPTAAIIAGAALIASPGSLVPDIQRYVSGQESFFKRLAVSVVEDVTPEGRQQLLVVLLGHALLAQRVPGFRPHRAIVEIALEECATLVSDCRCIEIMPSPSCAPHIVGPEQSSLANASALLTVLRSFLGDLNMFRTAAKHWNDASRIHVMENDVWNEVAEVASLPHDQHWAPRFVTLVDPKVLASERVSGLGGPVFAQFFQRVFSQVGGLNPRRPDGVADPMRHPLLAPVRKAQRLFWRAYTSSKVISGCPEQTKRQKFMDGAVMTLNRTLDDSWLSGLAGPFELRVDRRNVMAILPLSDPAGPLICAARPTRGNTNVSLSAVMQEKTSDAARAHMRTGTWRLNACRPPALSLEGKALVLRQDSETGAFVLRLRDYDDSSDVEGRPWDELRNISLTYQVAERDTVGDPPSGTGTVLYGSVESAWMHAALGPGERSGVQCDADIHWRRWLRERATPPVLRRTLMYLRGTSSESFEIARVGREGSGTDGEVSSDDPMVFRVLLRLSWEYPDALLPLPGRPGMFTVRSLPLLWHARDLLVEVLDAASQESAEAPLDAGAAGAGGPGGRHLHSDSSAPPSAWGSVKDDRKLWEHQTATLETMRNSSAQGVHGYFVDIPVGMGKTAIVAHRIGEMSSRGELPERVLFCLPSSAFKSVFVELQKVGLPVVLLNPHATSKVRAPDGCAELRGKAALNLPKYTVILLEHDHMRHKELGPVLIQSACNMMVVIDEVHKAMFNTQRTSMALSLCKLSREFITMTGTPVVDSDMALLIQWLRLLVPFDVTGKNFFVAAMSMIAHKVSTGVRVEREEYEVALLGAERRSYQKLVPRALGGSRDNPTAKDWESAAQICYDACSKVMVALAVNLSADGVMVIAKDAAHAAALGEAIRSGRPLGEVKVLQSGESLMEDDMSKTRTRVVVVPRNRAEGYTLTALGSLVTSVYPSNQANREQLEGRINRIGQKRKSVKMFMVHGGVLTLILKNHVTARNLSVALQAVAEQSSRAEAEGACSGKK